MSSLILKGRLYDVLKWATLVLLPAFGTLYVALADTWNLPNSDEVSKTVLAVCAFLGIVLGISSAGYANDPSRFDGYAFVQPDVVTNNPTVMLKDPQKTEGEVRLQVLKTDGNLAA